MLIVVSDIYCLITKVSDFRSLWKKETELKNEIDRLDSEIVKAQKNLDMAQPGVSYISVCNRYIFVCKYC